jgi:hypothetical protein
MLWICPSHGVIFHPSKVPQAYSHPHKFISSIFTIGLNPKYYIYFNQYCIGFKISLEHYILMFDIISCLDPPYCIEFKPSYFTEFKAPLILHIVEMLNIAW